MTRKDFLKNSVLSAALKLDTNLPSHKRPTKRQPPRAFNLEAKNKRPVTVMRSLTHAHLRTGRLIRFE